MFKASESLSSKRVGGISLSQKLLELKQVPGVLVLQCFLNFS